MTGGARLWSDWISVTLFHNSGTKNLLKRNTKSLNPGVINAGKFEVGTADVCLSVPGTI